MAHKRYEDSYVGLRDKLKRMAVLHPVIGRTYCKLATLLLDTALKNRGYLPSQSYYKTCFERPEMTYTDWIAQLKRAGLLTSYRDEDQVSEKKSDWIRYKPGPVLLYYVNKEKPNRHEMASIDDVDHKVESAEKRIDEKKADRSELEATRSELEATKIELGKTNQIVKKIAVAVRKLQAAKEPPITDEKLEAQRQAEWEIGEHTKDLVN